MKIRKPKKFEYKEIGSLIARTFERSNFNEGTKMGVQNYLNHYLKKENFEKMKASFDRSKIFYIVEDKGKIVGIIRGSPEKLINLFVAPEYHKRSIGKKLLLKFESKARKKKSKFIKINASLFATKFYQKMGYKRTTGIRNFSGIKVNPMIKRLK